MSRPGSPGLIWMEPVKVVTPLSLPAFFTKASQKHNSPSGLPLPQRAVTPFV